MKKRTRAEKKTSAALKSLHVASNFGDQLREALKARGGDERMSIILKSVHASSDFDGLLKALWTDTKYRALQRQRAADFNADPEIRARARERMKTLNANPKFKAWLRTNARQLANAIHSDPERKNGWYASLWGKPEQHQQASTRMKVISAAPERKKKFLETLKALWADREFRSRHSKRASERMRKLNEQNWRDPEFRRKQSKIMTALYADPKFRARCRDARWGKKKGKKKASKK